MGLDQQKQQMAMAEQQAQAGEDPRVAELGAEQQVASGNMDLEAKHQQMRHAEDMHAFKLEQMKAQAASAGKGEDPRFADQKLKQGDDLHKEKIAQMQDQRKSGQAMSAEKLKQMRLKPKADQKAPPKEKKK